MNYFVIYCLDNYDFDCLSNFYFCCLSSFYFYCTMNFVVCCLNSLFLEFEWELDAETNCVEFESDRG